MKMPVVFVGHGSPMNMIEKNAWVDAWTELGTRLPKPKAIVCISAHWYTRGTYLTQQEEPKMIYDMYGFPDELYEFVYPAKTDEGTKKRIKELLYSKVSENDEWGYDHGCYSVLMHMYPNADIPVIQLSVNAEMDEKYHYDVGRALRPLREEGVLILGSGNIVHNLRRMNPKKMHEGEDWAIEFDDDIEHAIKKRNVDELLAIRENFPSSRYAVPIPDHFFPMLYTLGAADSEDTVEVFNKDYMMGSLSMTSYLWEAKSE